jgi:hypothetical protein
MILCLFLLKLGADTQKRDNNGLTIFDLALHIDRIDSRIIELLKEYGGKSSVEILSEEIRGIKSRDFPVHRKAKRKKLVN